MQGNDEVIFSYQRFYCIALVTLLERLKGLFTPDIQTLITIAYTVSIVIGMFIRFYQVIILLLIPKPSCCMMLC